MDKKIIFNKQIKIKLSLHDSELIISDSIGRFEYLNVDLDSHLVEIVLEKDRLNWVQNREFFGKVLPFVIIEIIYR